jgi:hypothetical protein
MNEVSTLAIALGELLAKEVITVELPKIQAKLEAELEAKLAAINPVTHPILHAEVKIALKAEIKVAADLIQWATDAAAATA